MKVVCNEFDYVNSLHLNYRYSFDLNGCYLYYCKIHALHKNALKDKGIHFLELFIAIGKNYKTNLKIFVYSWAFIYFIRIE